MLLIGGPGDGRDVGNPGGDQYFIPGRPASTGNFTADLVAYHTTPPETYRRVAMAFYAHESLTDAQVVEQVEQGYHAMPTLDLSLPGNRVVVNGEEAVVDRVERHFDILNRRSMITLEVLHNIAPRPQSFTEARAALERERAWVAASCGIQSRQVSDAPEAASADGAGLAEIVPVEDSDQGAMDAVLAAITPKPGNRRRQEGLLQSPLE